MSMMRLCGGAVAAMLLVAASAAGQDTASAGAGRLHATRPELEARQEQLTELARLSTATETERARAGLELAAVRARLADGDFRVGDRIVMRVETEPGERVDASPGRSVEEQLTDTFTVGSDARLTLPVIGTVALRGILRAELQEQLTRAVGRVIRDPVVHAQPLLRFSVQGGVARPGYYSLPADAVLSDALMAAGGPAREARVAKLRIERDGEPLWEGDPLQRAIADGRTLDDMNLRAGDQFVVPERRAVADAVRTIGIALTIPVTLLTLISLF